MTWAKTKSRMLNWLSHPGAPGLWSFLSYFLYLVWGRGSYLFFWVWVVGCLNTDRPSFLVALSWSCLFLNFRRWNHASYSALGINQCCTWRWFVLLMSGVPLHKRCTSCVRSPVSVRLRGYGIVTTWQKLPNTLMSLVDVAGASGCTYVLGDTNTSRVLKNLFRGAWKNCFCSRF